jgi:Lipoprotein signal peptidase
MIWLSFGIAVLVIAADQLTKWWALNSLTPGVRRPLLGDLLGLQLTTNSGAAFSVGTQSTWIFTIIAAAAVIVIVWFAWRVRSTPWAVALGLVLGGAATHLGDRLFRPPSFGEGHVVDFIAYANWFIGNVADIAIVGGAVFVVALVVFGVPTGRDPSKSS